MLPTMANPASDVKQFFQPPRKPPQVIHHQRLRDLPENYGPASPKLGPLARVRGAHVSPAPTGRRGAATGKAARSFPTAPLFPLSRPTGPRLPSLPHAAPSGLSGHLTEVLDFRHSPRPLPPSCAIPKPRPLRSAGVTRPLRYYGPIRHPAGPGCPSRAPGGRVRATDGASRVASVPLSHACRRQYPGGDDRCARRSLPGRCQPSP